VEDDNDFIRITWPAFGDLSFERSSFLGFNGPFTQYVVVVKIYPGRGVFFMSS